MTLTLILVSIPMVLSGSAVLIFASAVLIGAAFGVTFSGSFRHLTQVVPAGQRGGVMSAFYLCCYFAMAVPTILAGAAATRHAPAEPYRASFTRRTPPRRPLHRSVDTGSMAR